MIHRALISPIVVNYLQNRNQGVSRLLQVVSIRNERQFMFVPLKDDGIKGPSPQINGKRFKTDTMVVML